MIQLLLIAITAYYQSMLPLFCVSFTTYVFYNEYTANWDLMQRCIILIFKNFGRSVCPKLLKNPMNKAAWFYIYVAFLKLYGRIIYLIYYAFNIFYFWMIFRCWNGYRRKFYLDQIHIGLNNRQLCREFAPIFKVGGTVCFGKF